MADLNISLGFDVEESSIRKVQSEISKALRDTTPELDIAVDPQFFIRLQKEIGSLGITLNDIRTDPAALDFLRGSIEENLAIEVRSVDASQRTLAKLRKDIEEAIANLDVAIRLEEARTKGAVPGRGAISKNLAQDVKDTDVKDSSNLAALAKQREEAGAKLVNVLAREALVEQQITDARFDNQRNFTKRGTDNVKALGRLNDILDRVANEGVSLEKALQQAKGVRGIGESSGAGELVKQKREELVDFLRDEIKDSQAAKSALAATEAAAKAKAEADAIVAETLLELNRENNKNLAATKRLTQIEQNLNDDLINASVAIKQIRAIDLDSGTSAMSAATRAAADAMEARVQTLRKTEQDEKDVLAIVAEIESAEKETAKILREQNKSLRTEAGFGSRKVEASKNILRELEKEANVIAQGQSEIKKSFLFLGARIRESAKNAVGKKSTAPKRGAEQGSSITFTNAADVKTFSDSLNPKQLKEFSLVLSEVAQGTNKAQTRLAGFVKSVRDGRGTQTQLNDSLGKGSSRAQEFGKQVGIAAKRLLAWAAPANLIFTTISRLRQAVDEIIEIDKQARRLIFFQNSGGIITKAASELQNMSDIKFSDLGNALGSASLEIDKIFEATKRLAVTNAGITKQFKTLATIARSYGLSLKDTTEALLEVARVGQQVNATGTESASIFTDAALSLIRVEAGALGASEAVRGLQAIQAQFFGGRQGNVFEQAAVGLERQTLAAIAASNAAAVLASASAGSSASVSELVDATTRLGSAFVNIQGLNFPQTIAIIGEAFTATGATTGRLATALRQTSTLIAQNAEEINKLTGIKVTNADGTIRDFTAILDVLKRVRDTAGTLESTELSLLIADRRNVADIQALAQSVDGIQAAFDKFEDPVQRVNSVMAAALTLYDQTQASVDSLEGQINNLSTAFTTLVNSEGIREFASFWINFATQAVDGANKLASGIAIVTTALKPLAKIALVAGGLFAANQVRLFGKGLLAAVRGAGQLSRELTTSTNALRAGENVADNLNRVLEKGLFTEKQKEAILRKQRSFGQQRLQLEAQIAAKSAEIVRARQGGVATQQQINTLEAQENSLLRQAAQLKQQNLATSNLIADAAEREARARQKSNAKLAVVGVVGGLAAAGANAAGFEKVGTLLGDAVSAGMAGAIAGGAVGAIGGPFAAVTAAGTAVVAAFGSLVINAGLFLGQAFREESINALKAVEAQAGAKVKGGATRLFEDIFEAGQKAKKVATEVDAKAQQEILNLEASRKELKKKLALLVAIEAENKQTADSDRETAQLRAGVGEIQAALAESIKRSKQRKFANDEIKLTNKLLQSNTRLVSIITNGESDTRDVLAAREQLEKNLLALKKENIKILPDVVKAERDAKAAAEGRLAALKSISQETNAQAALRDILATIPQSDKEKFALKLELDAQAFDAGIREIENKIKVLKATQTTENAEQTKTSIIALEEEKRTKGLAEAKALFAKQNSVLANANKNTTNQIKQWESASSRVTKAFADVAKDQKKLADIFKTIGKAQADIIARTSDATRVGLEATGASIAGRLQQALSTSQKRLGNLQQTFGAQQSTLGSRFSNTGDVASSAKSLVKIMGAVISKSDEAVAQARRRVVTTAGAESRELARAAKAEFDLRVKETRREIAIRRTLLTGQIKAFQDRFNAEKELNDLRRSQQEEFGRALIESPEKFKKTLENITSATNFFRGITDINADSLKTLQRRSENLRQQGPQGQEALRTILSGVQAAVAGGGPDIISGVGNRKLEQIFTRVQRENTVSLANDLQAQKDELNSQSQIQREIDARQKALVDLAKFDASLQGNILNVTQSAAQIAVKQRDAQRLVLEGIDREAIVTRNSIVAGQKAFLAVISQIPGAANPSGNAFANNILGVLKKAGVGGTLAKNDIEGQRALEKAAKDLTNSLGTFVSGDSAKARVENAERKKLLDSLKKQREEFAKSITTVSDFGGAMNKARNSTGLFIEATAKQTGIGLEDPSVGNKAKEFIGEGLGGRLEAQFSGFNQFRNAELAELKKRIDTGGQLTKVEKNRIRELERQGRQGFRNDPRGGRKLARRLLRDEGTQSRIVGQFRGTLQDTENNNDFIDRARRLRGESSSSRGVNVEAVQKFLQGSGFEGASRTISTKGQAANVLDRFIEISERLSKEQDEISKETKKKIIQVLGDELVTGMRGVMNKSADKVAAEAEKAEKDRQAKAKEKEDETSQMFQRAVNKIQEAALSEETLGQVKTAIKEGGDEAAQTMKMAIEEGSKIIAETKIQVDEVQLRANVTGQINVAVDNDIGQAIFDALSPILGRSEALRKIVEDIKQALINANFPGVRALPQGEVSP